MDKPLRFYFARHGQTDWNCRRQIQGSTEIPLNSAGHRQALNALKTFKSIGPISSIVTSTQGRAMTTATIFSFACATDVSIKTENGLRERSFGANEGRHIEDLHGVPTDPDRPDCGWDFPACKDVEPFEDVIDRSLNVVGKYLIEDYQKEGDPIFVSHSGVGKALQQGLGCKYKRIENARLYLFEQRPNGRWDCNLV
jgi:broad specificity phosphatase PhoE